MGACASSNLTPEQRKQLEEERARNRALEAQIRSDRDKESIVYKLLLLGAGESGKSTLFKQMITIYGKGFSEEERKNYTTIVYNNVITAMKTLCINLPRYTKVQPENEAAYNAIRNDVKEEIVDEKMGNILKQLWNDNGIKTTFNHRSDFQLADSAEYFFDRLDAIKQPTYIPSQQDVLRSRVRTTGIVENDFIIEGNHFKLFDVGGQRNERKKWIHCFENVTAVIFVAAISEYDQKLYEDESTNRVDEALKLFQEICAMSWFDHSCMILFLNKSDIFAKKIQTVNLSHYFPAYNGQPGDAKTAEKWMQELFLARGRNSKQEGQPREIFAHVTCATNTDNIQHVFNAITKTIRDTALANAGLK